MPRFFLHIDEPDGRIADDEGSDLPDLATAREEALAAARQLWSSAILERRDLGGHRFVIVDGEGRIAAHVPFLSALPDGLLRRLKDPPAG